MPVAKPKPKVKPKAKAPSSKIIKAIVPPKGSIKRSPRATAAAEKLAGRSLRITKAELKPIEAVPCWGSKPGCLTLGKRCSHCQDFVCDTHVQRDEKNAVSCRKCKNPAKRILRRESPAK